MPERDVIAGLDLFGFFCLFLLCFYFQLLVFSSHYFSAFLKCALTEMRRRASGSQSLALEPTSCQGHQFQMLFTGVVIRLQSLLSIHLLFCVSKAWKTSYRHKQDKTNLRAENTSKVTLGKPGIEMNFCRLVQKYCMRAFQHSSISFSSF